MTAYPKTTIRLTAEDKAVIARLRKRLGLRTATDVIRLALRELDARGIAERGGQTVDKPTISIRWTITRELVAYGDGATDTTVEEYIERATPELAEYIEEEWPHATYEVVPVPETLSRGNRSTVTIDGERYYGAVDGDGDDPQGILSRLAGFEAVHWCDWLP
ncbi:MAG TPA: hypothetical protein VM013_09605 [Dehalococcoidia bacterium]|nr:hypothetical protein [Dehalococcoidia bacterium]